VCPTADVVLGVFTVLFWAPAESRLWLCPQKTFCVLFLALVSGHMRQHLVSRSALTNLFTIGDFSIPPLVGLIDVCMPIVLPFCQFCSAWM